MTMPGNADEAEWQNLDARIQAILPALYHECYEDVLPISMGSASLKFDAAGRVAWDEMWTTFCDLALAGGPPHRGTLLQPATPEEITRDPEASARVGAEIQRGIFLVTGLSVESSAEPGWLALRCGNAGMAAWMVRAIVAENVLARQDGEVLFLPVGPGFRLEKEIKNVITVVAKACHYWNDHTPTEQQARIAERLTGPGGNTLLGPGPIGGTGSLVFARLAEGIHRGTGMPCTAEGCAGWIGVRCPDDRMAVWLMRVMIAEDILARREGMTLFLPANPAFSDAECDRIISNLQRARRAWDVRLGGS